MPSLVYLSDDGNMVGEEAQHIRREDRAIKLLLNRLDDLTPIERSNLSKKIVLIFLEVLNRMKTIAPFQSLVSEKMRLNVSTSSDFSLNARIFFLEAVRQAGFKRALIENVVEEPVAAGLSYIEGYTPAEEPVYVLVCDYGGGTFDCSLISVSSGDEGKKKIDVLSTAGIADCGGVLLDGALFEYFISQNPLLNKKVHSDRLAERYVLQEIEQLKISLSSENSVERYIAGVRLENGDEPKLICTREAMERLIDNTQILKRSLKVIEWVLYTGIESKKKEPFENEPIYGGGSIRGPLPKHYKILFAGGTSKIPYIQQEILKHFQLTQENVANMDFLGDAAEFVVIGNSFSRAFEGMNLNRPPFKIEMEITSPGGGRQVVVAQECFEPFLQYSENHPSTCRAQASKSCNPIHLRGFNEVSISFINSTGQKKHFFKPRGQTIPRIDHDVVQVVSVGPNVMKLSLNRMLNGEIRVYVEAYEQLSEKARYIAPWRTDDISALINWYPPNLINSGGDNEPG